MGAIAEDVRVVGSLGAANDRVTVNNPGIGVVTVQLSGTFVGTVVFEVDSIEGATPGWTAVNAQNVTTGALVASATAAGIFRIDASGLRKVSVKCSLYTSGTVSVTLNASAASASPGLTSPTSGGGGAVTSVDGGLVTLGTTTNAGIITDTNGTAIAFLRGAIIQWAAFLARLPAALISGRLDVNLGAAPALVTVQGDAAAGSAVAGNPVLSGGWDGTNAQTLAVVKDGTVLTLANMAGIPAMGVNSANAPKFIGAAFQSADNTPHTSFSGLQVNALQYAYGGGTTLERVRNNTTTVVQASGVTTVQTINTDILNYNGRAFMAHANVTLYNGGSILMKLQMKDANGLFVDIPGATTGTVTSGADLLLNVGPTVWPANSATMFNVNFFLPRNIRLVTTIATASVTFSQSYDLPAN